MEFARLQAIGVPLVRRLAATLQGCATATVALREQAASEQPLALTSTGASETSTKAVSKAAREPTAGPPASTTGKTQKTEPLFWKGTYIFSLSGCNLIEAYTGAPPTGADDGCVKLSVVLDRTIFHPQGGGQPADNGRLSAEGLPDLSVVFVSSRKEDGAVVHDSVAKSDDATLWVDAAAQGRTTAVLCHVDEAKRRLFARLHSAGHLLDAAVRQANLHWYPGKGYHFPDGPYVEYVLNEESVKMDPKKAGQKEAIMGQIQANINTLTSAGGEVSVRYDEAGVRVVGMADEECPCGGTHVEDTAQIGAVVVKKLQNKQGNIRLAYTLEAMGGA